MRGVAQVLEVGLDHDMHGSLEIDAGFLPDSAEPARVAHELLGIGRPKERIVDCDMARPILDFQTGEGIQTNYRTDWATPVATT